MDINVVKQQSINLQISLTYRTITYV